MAFKLGMDSLFLGRRAKMNPFLGFLLWYVMRFPYPLKERCRTLVMLIDTPLSLIKLAVEANSNSFYRGSFLL